jgi:hypothetical protein
LKNALIKIIEPKNQVIVAKIIPHQPQHAPIKKQLQASKGLQELSITTNQVTTFSPLFCVSFFHNHLSY